MSDTFDGLRTSLSAHRNLLIAAVAVVALGAIYLGAGSTPTGEVGDTPTLEVSYPDYGPNPIWYPITNGNVSSEDVTIEANPVSPGEEGRLALSGDVDMGTMDAAGIADLHREGRFDDHVVIDGYYSEGDVYDGESAMQVFARADSNISDPTDLRGKTIALGEPGSTTNLMFKAVMDNRFNVSPDEYTILYKPDSAPVLLEQGEVDAAQAWTHHVVDEEWRQDYVSVIDVGAEYTEMYGDIPSNAVIVAPEDAVRDDPQAYVDALELIRDGADWSDRNEDVIIDAFAEESADFDRAVWAEVWNYMDYYHPLDEDRIAANNRLFELQQQYGEANTTVTMSDIVLDPAELAQQ